jgi:transcriptional regulator with XRE-family HTH domain
MNLKVVAQRIRDRRKRRGWSQRTLAEESGCHENTILAVEAGAELYVSTLSKIAQALETRVDLLTAPPRGGW